MSETTSGLKKVVVYYTDNRLEQSIDLAVKKQLLLACDGIQIISVSQKPIDFGENICVGDKPRSYLSLFEQVLVGIEHVEDNSIVYTCEHDVFYHPSHFDFVPPTTDSIYFNLNRFYWNRTINHFVPAIGVRALSQGVGYKGVFMHHIKEQVNARINNETSPWIGSFRNFTSEFPNVDVRHDGNFSDSKRFNGTDNSKLFYTIPYWGTPRLMKNKLAISELNYDAKRYLHFVFNRDNKPNPVVVPRLTRDMLPCLFNLLGYKNGAEIGVKLGNFSRNICMIMKGVNLKCVDPYNPNSEIGWDEQERRFAVAQQILSPFNAELIKKDSLQAAYEIPKGSLDFAYIDGNHGFDFVMQDIITWSDRVRPGGIVSGHDYDIKSVSSTVDAYVRNHGLELFITEKGEIYPDSSPSWFFVRSKKL